MDIPPGITYLVTKLLPQLSVPFGLVYAFHLCQLFFLPDVTIEPWLIKYAYAFCVPVYFAASNLIGDLVDVFNAKRLGAVLPPRVSDWTPGSLLSLARSAKNFKEGYPGEGLEKAVTAYGSIFNLRILFQNRILVAEPEYIKRILATEFENFEKGQATRHVMGTLLGVGVFASDGDMWKFHRNLTKPFFARDRISDFDIFDRHADVAIEELKKRLREGYAVDFQDLASRFTLDSATEFLCGNDLRTLSVGMPYPYNSQKSSHTGNIASANFIRAFNAAQDNTARRVRFGDDWPLFEFWRDSVKAEMKIIHAYLEPIIRDAIRRKAERKETSLIDAEDEGVEKVGEEMTLLDYLLKKTDDPKIIRDETLNILIAGRDTTASTLSFVVYMLAQHPAVLQRLRHEILTKVGHGRRPTIADFRDMKYLRAVINETLRLYPAVPFNMKTSVKAAVWPSMQPGGKPWYIPPRTRTPYANFVTLRREDLWGPDALKFDPDRFIDERMNQYLTPHPFNFIPFNAGPRICLGQQFAYHEMSFFLVRLLQTFSSISFALESQPPDSLAPEGWKYETGRKPMEKLKIRSHLTMYIKGGLWVRMEEASEGM